MKPKKIDYEEVSKILEYDPESGNFLWRKDASNPNNTKHGTKAGYEAKGYYWISIRRKIFPAGRLAWVLSHGCIDDTLQIDHINRNPLDNRLCNLRLVPGVVNQCNRNNRYGEKVPRNYTRRKNGTYRVVIKQKYITQGKTLAEAKALIALLLKDPQ